MFGHRHRECGGRGGRGFGGDGFGRGPFGGGGGPFGGRHGGPFGGGGRGRRMFDSGALRLVVLGLIAEEPRHGYDIIKALEQKFQGGYSPSPGSIYPMLQMLEEADLVVSQADGNKRLYSITDAGKAYLDDNKAELDRINARLDHASSRFSGAAIGEEARALTRDLFRRFRDGSLTPEQAKKVAEILAKARKDIGEL